MSAARGMHSFNSAIYYSPFETLTTGSPSYQPFAPNYTNVSQIISNPGLWSEIADVISINGVPMERSVTQITHLRSPAKAHEKVPGFLDAGTNTYRLNSNKTALATLMGFTNIADTFPRWGRCSWAVFFPDNGVYVFTGFLKSQPFEVPEDNRITIEAAVEISGKPIFYAFA
ncbi:MAG TPA: phage tail tube protein [Gemmata sp.]